MNDDDHDEDLRALGKQLPWDHPDEPRREAVRSSLLVAATTPAARPWSRARMIGGGFAAGALAAAAVAVIVVRRGDGAMPPERAQIEASAAADFERRVTPIAGGVDEVVRVHSGRVSLRVGAPGGHDRVRVATGDAEVEGEGRYSVAASGDALRSVAVEQGTATVRVRGQRAVFLASGHTWTATAVLAAVELQPAPAAAEPTGSAGSPPPAVPSSSPAMGAPPSSSSVSPPSVSPPSVSPPSVSPAVASSPSSVSPAVASSPSIASSSSSSVSALPAASAPSPSSDNSPRSAPSAIRAAAASASPHDSPLPLASTPEVASALEQHFRAGWELLQAGKAPEAARELAAAADAGGSDPLAADARYFEAIALARAGRKTEAEQALVAFLDRAPRSLRRGRAAVMLARLIAERGDATSARAWFASALADPDPDVARSARAGIAALPH